MAPANLVQSIKGRSSKHLQDEFPHLKKKCWGQHLWAWGYLCTTVGAVNEETVREYIESQKRDEDVEWFQIVAPEFAQSYRSITEF